MIFSDCQFSIVYLFSNLYLQLLDTIGQLQQVRFLDKSKTMLLALESQSGTVISTAFNSHSATPSDDDSTDNHYHLLSSGSSSSAMFHLEGNTVSPTTSLPKTDVKQSR